MADTIIAPAARDSDSGAAGWAVAVILLLGLVLFAVFVWPGLPSVVPSAPAPAQPNTMDINVSIPEGAIPGTNNGATNQNQGSGNPAAQPTQ